MFAVVPAISQFKLVVVVFELKRGSHLPIRERPIAVKIIEIIFSVLEENAKRLLLRFSNQGRVNVATTNVGEAADMAQDLVEQVRSFPCDDPGANSAGTDATD